MVRYNYATTLAKLGRLSEAAVQFEIVIELMPEFASAYNNWGNVLAIMGDKEGARKLFTTALQHDPNHSDARQNLSSLDP